MKDIPWKVVGWVLFSWGFGGMLYQFFPIGQSRSQLEENVLAFGLLALIGLGVLAVSQWLVSRKARSPNTEVKSKPNTH